MNIRLKGNKRVFLRLFSLLIVLLFSSIIFSISHAQTSSGGNGYANAIISHASISIDAYLLNTNYSDYYGLHFDLYIESSINTIVSYTFHIESGSGMDYSVYPYVKQTYASVPPGPGTWNYFSGNLIKTYAPISLQLTYETPSSNKENALIPANALPLNISILVGYDSLCNYAYGYINATDVEGGGGSCVYALEPILMANGTYQIAENIKVGDKIMTYNFSTYSEQTGIVTNVTITNESKMYIINGVLFLASDQKVWTENGWVMAENLTYNNTIYDVYDEQYTHVYSIIIVKGGFPMYDFTININGNYIAVNYILKDLGGIHAC